MTIYLQIFSHLSGSDLVRFTKTSKQTFKFAVSASRKQLWRALRLRAEFPALPGLSDVHSIFLLYGQHCEQCQYRHNAWNPRLVTDWERRKSLCLRCDTRKLARTSPSPESTILDDPEAIHPLLQKVLIPVQTEHAHIFSYLEGSDLMAFAQVDRRAFHFMTAADQRQLWQVARAKEELVPFPEVRSAIAFVLLAYYDPAYDFHELSQTNRKLHKLGEQIHLEKARINFESTAFESHSILPKQLPSERRLANFINGRIQKVQKALARAQAFTQARQRREDEIEEERLREEQRLLMERAAHEVASEWRQRELEDEERERWRYVRNQLRWAGATDAEVKFYARYGYPRHHQCASLRNGSIWGLDIHFDSEYLEDYSAPGPVYCWPRAVWPRILEVIRLERARRHEPAFAKATRQLKLVNQFRSDRFLGGWDAFVGDSLPTLEQFLNWECVRDLWDFESRSDTIDVQAWNARKDQSPPHGPAKKLRTEATELHDASTPNEPTQTTATTFTRTRQTRQTKKKPSGRSPFLNLPFDVIYEIFSYLEARDLIQFSKTDKQTFKLMTSKAQEQLWRAARAKLDTVAIPEMSDLEYVLFTQGRYCQVGRPEQRQAGSPLTSRSADVWRSQNSPSQLGPVRTSLFGLQGQELGTVQAATKIDKREWSFSGEERHYDIDEIHDWNRLLWEWDEVDEIEQLRVEVMNENGIGRAGFKELEFTSKLHAFIQERKKVLDAARARAQFVAEMQRRRQAELEAQRRAAERLRQEQLRQEARIRQQELAERRRTEKLEHQQRMAEAARVNQQLRQERNVRFGYVREQLSSAGATAGEVAFYSRFLQGYRLDSNWRESGRTRLSKYLDQGANFELHGRRAGATASGNQYSEEARKKSLWNLFLNCMSRAEKSRLPTGIPTQEQYWQLPCIQRLWRDPDIALNSAWQSSRSTIVRECQALEQATNRAVTQVISNGEAGAAASTSSSVQNQS
ncbi:hypothetical protein ACM66B_004179 [Microbotryomycetes sp. NB124-2]